MPPHTAKPEQRAREKIDRLLAEAGWVVQNRDEINLSAAGRGIAIREFKMAEGFGFADYLLYVDKQAIGALEAKPAGFTLSGVKPQVDKYSKRLARRISRHQSVPCRSSTSAPASRRTSSTCT